MFTFAYTSEDEVFSWWKHAAAAREAWWREPEADWSHFILTQEVYQEQDVGPIVNHPSLPQGHTSLNEAAPPQCSVASPNSTAS